MIPAIPIRPAVPFDRREVADQLDEAQLLFEAAEMAVGDFLPDPRATAVHALLTPVGEEIGAISRTVLPGGGS